MRVSLLASFAVLTVLLAGCGGSSNAPTQAPAGKLVAKVSDAKVAVDAGRLKGSVKVVYGGMPGERLTLAWGLVDAVTGVRASQGELALAHPTTTADVVTHTYPLDVKAPTTPTDYIVHYALYAPDGTYLASKDTSIFTVR
jgi:hypothetical protein